MSGLTINEGAALRDAGCERTLRKQKRAWIEQASNLLTNFGANIDEFLAEDFRAYALACGLRKPDHPNAWGALWRSFKTGGFIHSTGRVRPSQDPRSHGRVQPTWTTRLSY